jgi:hypothetical protein
MFIPVHKYKFPWKSHLGLIMRENMGTLPAKQRCEKNQSHVTELSHLGIKRLPCLVQKSEIGVKKEAREQVGQHGITDSKHPPSHQAGLQINQRKDL